MSKILPDMIALYKDVKSVNNLGKVKDLDYASTRQVSKKWSINQSVVELRSKFLSFRSEFLKYFSMIRKEEARSIISFKKGIT